jgi:L-cystine transport system permease protein
MGGDDGLLELAWRSAPLLARGAWNTIWIGMVSFALALAIGFLVAGARLYGPLPLRWLAIGFVSVLCGTPLLVQILLIYYGLPQFGLAVAAIPSVILALALHVGAFVAEDFRGSLQSVNGGQWDAGAALGLSFRAALWRIVAPQALRAVLPTLGTRFIGMMKETSLASVVTVVELTRVAESVGASTFRYLEMFVIIAAIYWSISTVLALGQAWLERRLAWSGRNGVRPSNRGARDG